MVDMDSIQEFRDRIVKQFNPEKVILFGSYAYGSPSIESDVDILVILRFEGNSAYMSAEILNRTDPRFPVDLLTRTPEQVEERLGKGDFFFQEIVKKGKVLYDAAHKRMG